MNEWNRNFFKDIRQIIEQAKQKAYSAVNFAMVEAYWNIGRRIVEEEQKGKTRAEYGKRLVKELSKHLAAQVRKGIFRSEYMEF